MKKKFNFVNSGMRPALAMLLCTCIAFSAAVSYVPPAQEAGGLAAAKNSSAAELIGEQPRESEETEASSMYVETEAQETETNNPAPYRLNFAYLYPEGSKESYAQIFMKELIRKDSQWYAEIYDMANMAPAKLAPKLGRTEESVRGRYHPASQIQSETDPTTWSVEHFKNVRISFYNGDGAIASAVSNAQDILSMASVYAYYHGLDDMDEIRSYMNALWRASHSYHATMGEVYYCEGCVDPDEVGNTELEDSELEGEDQFNSGSTIDTEITDADALAEPETDENGAAVFVEDSFEESDAEILSEGSITMEIPESSIRENGIVIVPENNGSAPSETSEKESTTSVLDSLAATAESVYIEETKPKVVIVRPTEEEETTKPASPIRPTKSTETETDPKALEESSTEESSEAETKPRVIVVHPTEQKDPTEDGSEDDAQSPAVTVPAEEDNLSSSALQEASAEQMFPDYHVHAAALTETREAAGSSNKICPGHIDLKVTAQIHTLSDINGLYSLDTVGNTLEEGSAWPGWTNRTKAFVRHIGRQDWTEAYGFNVIIEGSRAPLSETEIESYMNRLPDNTTEERKNIIRFALQSVGKVPYYWGGKASSPNYGGNNFGSVTIPDHRGRILRGLDCSGWVNWVYWSVTGKRLPYEGTEGLKSLGRQVDRKDLKPGDLVVITGKTPHVIMFLGFTDSGQIQCIHETGSANNVTVGVMNANWPYYRNILD